MPPAPQSSPKGPVGAMGAWVRGLFGAAGARYRGSLAEEGARRLDALDFGNTIVLFGACLLLSILPLIIILSTFANQRIDDDIARHLELNRRGAQILEQLFKSSPVSSDAAIVTSLIIAVVGTITAVGLLQGIYERAFDQTPRGIRTLVRRVVWIAALGALLIIGAAVNDLAGTLSAGPVIGELVTFVAVGAFLLWTMHFLLCGRVHWRELVAAAVSTAALWLGLRLFSSLYFSSTVITDSRIYGTIGVVFSLMTWFIAIGAVLMLGAVAGAIWEEARRRRTGSGRP